MGNNIPRRVQPMLQRSIHFRFSTNARLAALLCWTIGALAGGAPCIGRG